MEQYKYFVSCNVQSPTLSGFSNHEVLLTKPISNIGDVKDIATLIESNEHLPKGSVCILGYQLLNASSTCEKEVLQSLISKVSSLELDVVSQRAEDSDKINLRLIGKQEAFEEVLSLLNSVQSRQKWIYCKERQPREDEMWIGHDITNAEPREFIVVVKGATEPTTGYYTSYGWVKDVTPEYDRNNTGYNDEVIAWRHFPSCPKEEI